MQAIYRTHSHVNLGCAETGKMQISLLRIFLLAGILFPVLLITVILLFALLLGGLPNDVQLQPTVNLAFLQILWQGNPWETVKLVLVDKPLVMVEHLDHGSGLQLWGMFYYAGTVLVYLLTATFTALHLRRLRTSTTRQIVLFATGTAAVLISVTYLKLAACCTGGPGWVLDTWLLTYVFTPNTGGMDWMLVYERLQPWLSALQASMLVAGMAILCRWHLGTRKTAAA